MAIESCMLSLFLFASLPKIPEGAFWLMGDTGIELPSNEKIIWEKTQKAKNQSKDKQPLTTEERLAFFERILPSEVVLSVLVNLYAQKGSCVWLSIDSIFSFIETNIYCNEKIPDKSTLEKELSKLHELGYIRYLPGNPNCVIAQPNLKDTIETSQTILC